MLIINNVVIMEFIELEKLMVKLSSEQLAQIFVTDCEDRYKEWKKLSYKEICKKVKNYYTQYHPKLW